MVESNHGLTMTQRVPGLLVARHVLWRIAMLCTVVGLVLVAVGVTVGTLSTNPDPNLWIGYIGAVLFYVGVACWIAYAIVRMVGRERLGAQS
jgi:protein-S-isoprenylcysteine O-methyltransferase Ste14